jgi:heavy metal sensor kinase
MRHRLPVRIRLTLWYGAIFTVALAAAAAVAWFAMRASLYSAVDQDLRARAGSAAADLTKELSQHGDTDLRTHLLEHAGGEAWQIRAPDGAWVYRAAIAAEHDVPLDILPVGRAGPVLSTLLVGGERYRAADIGASGGRGPAPYTLQLVEPLDPIDGALQRFASAAALASPLLLILAGAAGYWISGRALLPIDRMTRTAQRLNERNLSERIPLWGPNDELQRLAETLNAMLDRLERAFARLTEFTADASHELRTPVALIRARTEVLLRHPRTDEEWREGVREIHDASLSMSDLVDALLTLARADAGVESLESGIVNLDGLLRGAVKTILPLAAAKQLHVTGPAASTEITIPGDATRLERLFLILLDNAVKYTAQHGTIVIEASRGAGVAVVSIRDTGVGISDDDLPGIFERFYRSDKVRSRGAGGFGLGLSIARSIAQAHGGTIEVSSRVGVGSDFRVRLPAGPTIASTPSRNLVSPSARRASS